MAQAVELRKALRPRIRVLLKDDPRGSVPLTLPVQKSVPLAIMFGAMFVIFAYVDFRTIRGLLERKADTVFHVAGTFFEGFWALAWTAGVLVLLGATLLMLFYRQSARLSVDRLIHVSRLGPLRVLSEYELARIRNLRVEGGKKSGVARIQFDYDGGNAELGDGLERSMAEQYVKAIAESIAALAPVTVRPEAAQPEELVSQVPPVAQSGYLSAIFLVAANLVPIAGVLLLDWNVADLMVLFWAENVVIGLYALLKLAVVARWWVVVAGPAFLGHYGAFLAIHFMLVYHMFVRGNGAIGPEPAASTALISLFVPLWPALLSLVISHGVSFFCNFLARREYVGRKASEQTAEPYRRIALMHVTLILGAWPVLLLGQPLPALLLLLVLKTVMDLWAHRKERAAAGRRRAP